MRKNRSRPYFVRFLEPQELADVTAGKTLKYPSDNDEVFTLKYPSDDDEDVVVVE